MAAQLYKTNGAIYDISPPNGVHWTPGELQGLVGGPIEIYRTIDGKWMVVNDLGKVQSPWLPLNKAATRIYQHGRIDPIVGPAVVIDNFLELNGPEKED